MTRDEARGHSRKTKTAARKLLERVRKLLERPERWCKRRDARRADGSPCAATSEHAVQWCLIGGMIRVMGDAGERAWALAMCWLSEPGETRGHGGRNDRPETTHSDLLAWLDRSIKRAREPEEAA